LSLSYYIYYRVADAELARSAFGKIQATVELGTGTTGRLLRKRDDPSTWMEIYEHVGNAVDFERCLADAVCTHRFDQALQPGTVRHMECFEDPCA
jgi:Domain of unknown function (DUF4936)